MPLQVIRNYTSSDGTRLVEYKDETGYQNTVPLNVFNKKFNSKKKKK
jgi:hypothetical protein